MHNGNNGISVVVPEFVGVVVVVDGAAVAGLGVIVVVAVVFLFVVVVVVVKIAVVVVIVFVYDGVKIINTNGLFRANVKTPSLNRPLVWIF